MRRPWELLRDMEKPAGPLVYVPLSLPDSSPSPSFAVLEFIGFSDSSPPSSSHFPQLRHNHHDEFPVSHVSPNSPSHLHIPISSSPSTSTAACPPEITYKSPDAAQVTFESSPTQDNPGATTTSKARAPILHTQIRENVVHTTTSDFKDVVQKLTGKAPSVKAAAAASKLPDALSVKTDGSKVGKKTRVKLHERRKALDNLKKLSTDEAISTDKPWPASRSKVSPSPSPVTPLASYLEKVSGANTPTASPSSHGSAVSSLKPSYHESDVSVSAHPFSIASQIAPYRMPPSEGNPCDDSNLIDRCASLLVQLIALQKSGPALLNLFPGSPRDM